jgi:hypothetical protein
MARSGLSGWPKKNQCHQEVAKRTSQALQSLEDRHAIYGGKMGDGGRMIHGCTEGGVAPAVTAYEGETLEA